MFTQPKNPAAHAKITARLVVATSFLANLSFILPVWLLYSLNVLHFSPTLAIGLYMAIWAVSGLLEIPTGALADRLGRRKLFIIGSLLLLFYPLAYIYNPPLIIFFIVCLVGAVGSAMQSGALIPVVHHAYSEAGLKPRAYNNFLSNYQVATFVARVASGLTGALMYAYNPRLPFVAIAVGSLLNAGFGFLIKDNQKLQKTVTNTQHIKETFAVMRKSQLIVAILMLYVVFNFLAEAIWTGYQVFYQADGRSATVIGALFSMIAVFSALGAYTVRHIATRLHALRIFELQGLGVALTAFLLWQPNLWLRLAAIVPMGFVSGLTLFTINAAVQHNIENRYHSTALSMVNFIQYVVYGVASLSIGILLQFVGTQGTRTIVFVLSVLALTFGAVFVRHKRWLPDSITVEG